ncbi:MAG: DUF255 domain-containing protein, partial [Bacteroidota bacterium]
PVRMKNKTNKIFYRLFILFIFVLFTAASTIPDAGDGISFFEGTWQDALVKSANENKLIFLDLSTSWCGYCKKLKQNTFTDKKAGDYFNAKFINIELDAEQGEGK